MARVRRHPHAPTTSTRGATACPATSSASPRRGQGLYRELKDFVYRHIIHSFPVSRHDGHARRVIAGLFGAYRDNPRLLPDDVLRGARRELGVRFLREVPLADVERRSRRAIGRGRSSPARSPTTSPG